MSKIEINGCLDRLFCLEEVRMVDRSTCSYLLAIQILLSVFGQLELFWVTIWHARGQF